jgi:LEA14-like dessication related protein
MNIATKISIIFLFTVIFSGCYKQVEFKELETVTIDMNNSEGSFILFIKLNNPNFFPIKITESDLNFSVNNINFGQVNSKQKIKLPANTETIIEVPIKLSITGLLFQYNELINIFKNKEANFKIKGNIIAQAFFIKKTIDINQEKIVSLKN